MLDKSRINLVSLSRVDRLATIRIGKMVFHINEKTEFYNLNNPLCI